MALLYTMDFISAKEALALIILKSIKNTEHWFDGMKIFFEVIEKKKTF